MDRSTNNRHVVEAMLDELKIQNASLEELSKLGELMADPEARVDKLSEIYHKIISFGGRVDSAKKLIESWTKAMESECRAYGIADKSAPQQGRGLSDMSTDDLMSIIGAANG